MELKQQNEINNSYASSFIKIDKNIAKRSVNGRISQDIYLDWRNLQDNINSLNGKLESKVAVSISDLIEFGIESSLPDLKKDIDKLLQENKIDKIPKDVTHEIIMKEDKKKQEIIENKMLEETEKRK